MGFAQSLNPGNESNVLQSFDDNQLGRATFQFYAIRGVGSVYGLIRSPSISYPGSTGTSGVSTSTVNFDATITKATIMGGTAYLDVVVDHGATAVSSVNFKIYHVVGVTETLVSNSVDTDGTAASVTVNYKIPLTLTKKNFKPGSILRLKCLLTSNHATSSVTIRHDPLTAGSELILYMPVFNLE